MIRTDSKPFTKTLNVLHVDDDEDFLVISKRLLEKQGSLQVESADSVKQALEKIRQKLYDAIVSDYKMFDKTGLELFTEIRDNEIDVPFFLVTGEKREEIVNEALNLGVSMCFNKDGNLEELFMELASGIKEAVKAKHPTDI
jgi:DNA-binding NtrC family response regulator